jgi:RHS repeat-associated protein
MVENRPTSSVEALAYDADANLTNDGRWSFVWDAENRPLQMLSSNVVDGAKKKLDFVYDWRGRRRSKVVSTWSGSTFNPTSTNRFVYDNWNPVAEVDAANNLVRSYLWGMDLSGSMQGAGGVGGLVAVSIVTNGVHFAAYDGNGNVSGLVSGTNGAISAQYEYGTFGELIRSSGTAATANPCRFSTKYTDDESDFLYYGYRSYKPGTGRWINRDPLGEAGSFNLYCFVRDDPVDRGDPLGLVDCAALKRQIDAQYGRFNGDSEFLKSVLADQMDALTSLFLVDRESDAALAITGTYLGRALESARLAFTSRTIAFGESAAVDYARSGVLTGPGISVTGNYSTLGLGGPLGSIVTTTIGKQAVNLLKPLEKLSTRSVRNQFQSTVDSLNQLVDQEYRDLISLINAFRRCGCK